MLAHIIDVANDVVVPEAQNDSAVLLQAQCPGLVAGDWVRMLGAIDFDDKFLLRTSKVDNVAGDWKLPAEAKPHQTVREARSTASIQLVS